MGGAHGPRVRRAWLSQLKEEAVRLLPASASAGDRAKLRSEVEHALRGHGPDDPAPEILDIVATLVSETLAALEQAKLQAERTQRKAGFLAMAQAALEVLLQQYPEHLVGQARSQRRIEITQTLWHDLRDKLSQSLSGSEDDGEVLQVVIAHVTAWRREHERRWRPRLGKAIDTTVRVVEAARHVPPEWRQLASTVSQAVLDRLRQRAAPKDPPSS
jgi:DNA repair exonuclease SbcCD ATPase subunit